MSRRTLVNFIKKVVYEDKSVQPLKVKPAGIIKKLVVLVLFVVSVVVLYINLSNKSFTIMDNLKHVFYAIVITYMHVTYLYIVLNNLILVNPIERLYKQQLIFPVLLVFSYLFYALQITAAFSMNHSFYSLEIHFKVISLSLFCLLYLLWLLRDIFEYIENKKALSIIWMIGDVFSIFLLCCGLYFQVYQIEIDNTLVDFMTSINGPILICLLIYMFYRTISNNFIDEESYRFVYDKYLSNNKIENPPSITIPIPEGEMKILDFGCGDGRRLLENLSWINNLSDDKLLTIWGYDKRKCFKDVFEDKFENSGKKVSFISNLDDFNAIELDMIILSHVLYEQTVVEEVSAFLQTCKKGVIVYFRGASPNSFFVSTSFAGSNALNLFSRKKNKCHLWYSIWLEDITREVGLEHLDSIGYPYKYIVKQNYNISSKVGIESASELLRRLYAGELALRSNTYFQSLKDIAGQSHISNDDLIFMYIK